MHDLSHALAVDHGTKQTWYLTLRESNEQVAQTHRLECLQHSWAVNSQITIALEWDTPGSSF